MLKSKSIVINTSPILSISAALGNLDVLNKLFSSVIVPYEVIKEIERGGKEKLGCNEIRGANFLIKENERKIQPYLLNSLDIGEAAVIQCAIDLKIPMVCIDERVGRQVASLCGLSVTGSIGILIKSQQYGYNFSMKQAIKNMQEKGIWLSQKVVNYAMKMALIK